MRRRPLLSTLRAIGRAYWDPIGLGEPGPPPGVGDAYDRYLLHAADMLAAGRPAADVADYLVAVARHWIELPQAALQPAGTIAAAVEPG